jgi:L-asparaginase
MKNILVVFTGGTIGSQTNGATIDVHAAAGYELIRLHEEHYGVQARFTAIQPFALLSENMLPEDWEGLIRAIEEAEPARYDGVIITHGTDTLAYTAAALSYRFAASPVPILLTASNYPLDDVRSEGLRNFAACVSMIVHDPLPGVFVIFENHEGRMQVHLGTRIRQSEPFTDQFLSIYHEPFGEILGGRLQVRTNRYNPTIEEVRDYRKRQTGKLADLSFSGRILCVKPYPGFRYSHLRLPDNNEQLQAILLEAYHSGTTGIRFASTEDSLELFCKACRERNIDLYLAPVKDTGGNRYATSHEVSRFGVAPLANMSMEAALVKLMLAYGTSSDRGDIRGWLERNLFFEIV